MTYTYFAKALRNCTGDSPQAAGGLGSAGGESGRDESRSLDPIDCEEHLALPENHSPHCIDGASTLWIFLVSLYRIPTDVPETDRAVMGPSARASAERC